MQDIIPLPATHAPVIKLSERATIALRRKHTASLEKRAELEQHVASLHLATHEASEAANRLEAARKAEAAAERALKQKQHEEARLTSRLNHLSKHNSQMEYLAAVYAMKRDGANTLREEQRSQKRHRASLTTRGVHEAKHYERLQQQRAKAELQSKWDEQLFEAVETYQTVQQQKASRIAYLKQQQSRIVEIQQQRLQTLNLSEDSIYYYLDTCYNKTTASTAARPHTSHKSNSSSAARPPTAPNPTTIHVRPPPRKRHYHTAMQQAARQKQRATQKSDDRHTAHATDTNKTLATLLPHSGSFTNIAKAKERLQHAQAYAAAEHSPSEQHSRTATCTAHDPQQELSQCPASASPAALSIKSEVIEQIYDELSQQLRAIYTQPSIPSNHVTPTSSNLAARQPLSYASLTKQFAKPDT